MLHPLHSCFTAGHLSLRALAVVLLAITAVFGSASIDSKRNAPVQQHVNDRLDELLLLQSEAPNDVNVVCQLADTYATLMEVSKAERSLAVCTEAMLSQLEMGDTSVSENDVAQRLFKLGDLRRSLGMWNQARQAYSTVLFAHSSVIWPVFTYSGLSFQGQSEARISQQDFSNEAGQLMADAARCFATSYRLSHDVNSLLYYSAALVQAGNLSGALNAYQLFWARIVGKVGTTSQVTAETTASFTALWNSKLKIATPVPSAKPLALKSRLEERASQLCGDRDSWSRLDPASHSAAADFLQSHQFPNSCDNSRQLVYTFSQGFGMGAQAHMLSLAMSIAIVTNRVLVVDQAVDWWMLDSSLCQDGDLTWTCLFKPISGCTYHSGSNGSREQEYRSFLNRDAKDDRVLLFGWEEQTYILKSGLFRGDLLKPVQSRGVLWWRSHVLRWLMRPKSWLETRIHSIQKRLNWPGVGDREVAPVIGMHIRHGDKLLEANHHSVSTALDAAKWIAHSTQSFRNKVSGGLRAGKPSYIYVYVATDSSQVVKQLLSKSSSLQNQGIRIIVNSNEVRDTDITNANLLKTLNISVSEYATEAAVNAILLGKCSAIVGSFSSNLSRLAFELLLAAPSLPDTARIWGHQQKCPLPPLGISLDVPWFVYP